MNINENEKKLTQRSINAKETKNVIYNSALFLFSKYGYERVTIVDITKYAGVSKGNFYTHFKSKESVFVELFHRIDSHYIEVYKNVNKNETAINKLRILIDAMCDYCFNVCGIDAIKIVYASQISQTKNVEILNNKSRPFYYFIRKIVVEGQESGVFRNDISSEELVELIARCARALLYDWCLYNNEFNLIDESKNYTDFIIDSISKRR